MARFSTKPLELVSGVTFREDNGRVIVSGPRGEKTLRLLEGVTVRREDNFLTVRSSGDTKQATMNCGTMWSLMKNAIQGVSRGFSRNLEIQGIGYKAAVEGTTLVLSLGYVHPVRYEPPNGVTVSVEKNMIKISGIDKELVGRAASEIRALKKPEPYKGKGIRYEGEVVRKKAGKKAAVAGAGTAGS